MAALLATNERQEQEASDVVHRTLGVTFVHTLGEGAEGAVYLAKDPKTVRAACGGVWGVGCGVRGVWRVNVA